MDEELRRDHKSVNSETIRGAEIEPSRKALFHPFKCRLSDTAGIETSSATCMTQVGFACWSIGMLTIFRPSFVLLICILDHVNAPTSKANFNIAFGASCFWFALVMFVFFVLGWIPMFATSIKKRWVLLIHPWALLLLYLDAFVWLTVAVILHVQVLALVPSDEDNLKRLRNATVFFIIIYVDVLVYFIIYYVYGTYYIVAELTIIQKFY